MSRNRLAVVIHQAEVSVLFPQSVFWFAFFSFLISGTESEMSRSTVKEQNWGSLDLNL